MKKAVIATGGKQYLVTEGQTLEVELLNQDNKTATFVPLLIIEGDKATIGTPEISASKVTAEVVNAEVLGDKVMSIRYKAKKRVHTVRGHRQRSTQLKIIKIS